MNDAPPPPESPAVAAFRARIRRELFWLNVQFAAVVLGAVAAGVAVGLATYQAVLEAVVVRQRAPVVVFAGVWGLGATSGVLRWWNQRQDRAWRRRMDRIRRGLPVDG